MASPFRYFRKHTKAFMAAATVMCMFLFVFARGTGRGRSTQGVRQAGATVATWNGGKINERELDNLVHNRKATDEFLRRLFMQGGGESPGYDLPQSLLQLLLRSQRRDYVEMVVIDAEVVSSLALHAGMTVSDDMINHCLEMFSRKNVTGDQIEGIFASLGQGGAAANEAVVFNTLRKMLLAYFYRQSYQDAGAVVLPEQRWEDWRRVNERISLTAAALPVESFEKDVPDPTEAQLQALYQEFKDVEPHQWLTVDGRDMPSATPGFAEPRRVRLAFLRGGVAERTEKYLDKVTDAEIADYYERNKRSEFVKTSFGTEDEEPKAEGESQQAPPATEPAPSDKPTGETPASDAAPDSDAAPAAPPADDAAPKSNQGAAAHGPSPFKLAAFQTTPAAESPAAESGTTQTTPADQATATSEPAPTDAAAAPADEAKKQAEANSTDGEVGEEKPAEDAAAPPATTPENAKPADAKAEDIVEYEPLEKVQEDIRRTLARDKAVAELERIMSEAAAQLQSEYNRYGSQVIQAREEKKEPPAAPERLTDLKWLADKYGLTVDKTAALTARELFDTAVGKAADAARGAVSVTGAAFTSLELYEPYLAKELEGDWYLAMKIEDQPRHVPEFSAVRDRVIAEWKRRAAATLAEKKAKELAEQAAKSAQPFEEFFNGQGYEVIPQTELFSWRSLPVDPESGNPPVLSEVPKLKNVGPEFMQAAFALGEGAADGVLNFDHSVAYVIKLSSRQYAPDELKELFLEEDRFWPGQIGTRVQRQQVFAGLVDKEVLQERAGLELDDEWLKLCAERGQRE